MVNTKSSLNKTTYKYTYKSPDGKTKKLPIFETTKGKYIVFVDGKRKYVNPKKMIGGTPTTNSTKSTNSTPLSNDQISSLITILENIPKYFASNYLIFTDHKRGGAPKDFTISMNNFINHQWSNKSQFVHFSNLNKNKEALKLIVNVFLMFFSLYVIWNYEIIFNYFNPDYAKKLPSLQQAYDNIQHLITSVPDDNLPMVIGESCNVEKPFNRIQIEAFFNEANKMRSNIKETEFNFIILLNLFFILLFVYRMYKLYIKNLRDTQKQSNAIKLNEKANIFLINKLKNLNNSTLTKVDNHITTKNANRLPNKRVLDKLFELYIDNDYVDIESFENLANKVDEKLAVFLQEKYQYILQPNSQLAIIQRDNVVVNDPHHKTKLERMSNLLHAMHNAQKTYLLSIHDPRGTGISNASLLHDHALRTFKETYETITDNEITYSVDETTGFITYQVTKQGPQLQQVQGGKRKMSNK